MRLDHGIHIDAHDWARAVAAILAGPAKPTGENLAWWCRWAGIEPPADADRMIASVRVWPKWKCRKWRARLGALIDLDPAERDDLSWWLPITPDETPEEATSRRKRRQAAERRQDARLAAEHEASLERDRKLRASGSGSSGGTRGDRRARNEPPARRPTGTRRRGAGSRQPRSDNDVGERACHSRVHSARRIRSLMSQSRPQGGFIGFQQHSHLRRWRKRGIQRVSVLLLPRLNPHRLGVRQPPPPPMRSTWTRLNVTGLRSGVLRPRLLAGS